MNEHRFRQLSEAYGAEIGRWPAADREWAAAFASVHPAHAEAILRSARQLDAQLDALASRDPSPALRQRAIDQAPRARALVRRWRWITAAGLGLGLAASAVAGVAAGVSLAPPSVTRLISGQPAPTVDDGGGLFADPTRELVDG